MSSLFADNQSDWSAFLNPDAKPLGPRKIGFPRFQSGPITRTHTGGRFCLIGNGHVSIAAVPGLVIRARQGTLWITQARDAEDHVIHAGERFVADRAGRLVLSAFERGEVELQWPTREQERARPVQARLAAAA
jgi:Protein of unknown function (DUF2917)